MRVVPFVVVALLFASLLPAGLAGGAPERREASSQSRDPSDRSMPASTGTGGIGSQYAREPGRTLIRLQLGAFDPLTEASPRQAAVSDEPEASATRDGVRYWLVQVEGDRYAAADAAITGAGATVVGVVLDNAYVVRASAVQVAAIDRSSAVRWTGPYQPSWKVPVAANGKPGLLDLAGQQGYRVEVWRSEPDPVGVRDALAAIAGV